MTGQGVILYGPPAAGKDTVTQALQDLNPRYHQFSRLKVGAGKSAGYRIGATDQLAELEAAGDVIYRNSRYGNTYVIDRPGLDEAFTVGVPVVHLGQIEGIGMLVKGYPARWTVVMLWCPREEAAARSADRGDRDTEARLAAWDATQADVDAHPGQLWNVSVDTSCVTAVEAARRIDACLSPSAKGADR